LEWGHGQKCEHVVQYLLRLDGGPPNILLSGFRGKDIHDLFTPCALVYLKAFEQLRIRLFDLAASLRGLPTASTIIAFHRKGKIRLDVSRFIFSKGIILIDLQEHFGSPKQQIGTLTYLTREDASSDSWAASWDLMQSHRIGIDSKCTRDHSIQMG
jgi:hypothetical protein